MNHKPPNRWNMICHLHRGQMSQYHLQLVASSKRWRKTCSENPLMNLRSKTLLCVLGSFQSLIDAINRQRIINEPWKHKNKMCVWAPHYSSLSSLWIFCLTFNKRRTSMSVFFHFLFVSISFPFPVSLYIYLSVLLSLILDQFSVISCTDCTFTVLYAYEM